jgi:hypothetical protein
MPDRHLLFYSQNIYFIGVHELIPLCGIRFLDEKSKQKNQEKIIPAFTHKAHRPAAIFSGPRALDFSLFTASWY